MKVVSSSQMSDSARKHLCPSLTFLSYCSAPVPVLLNSIAHVGFLIGRGEYVNVADGYRIWPPSLLALYDPKSGRLAELREFNPREIMPESDASVPFDAGLSPGAKSETEFLAAQATVFEICDDLIRTQFDGGDWRQHLPELEKAYLPVMETGVLRFCKALLMSEV